MESDGDIVMGISSIATEPWKSWFLYREIIPKWPNNSGWCIFFSLPRYIHIVHVCIYDSNNNMEYRDIMEYYNLPRLINYDSIGQ